MSGDREHEHEHHDEHGHDAAEPGMGQRGVGRPMPLMHGGHGDGGDDHEHEHEQDQGDDHGHGGGHHAMSRGDRLPMLRMHHRQTLWVYWTLLLLGVWLMLAPVTLGYLNPALWVDPSGGRGVWFSDQTHTALRAWLMAWSDLISGAVLTVFAWRSLKPDRPKSLWACCFIGMWVTFAPVVFWAPTAAAYLNDTIVGMLVIALSILIPGMPNMILYMQMGPPTPPGWSYNPSSWPQRWIMIATGFAGFVVSRYLAAFQLGYINHAWDPLFGEGSKQVLNSDMSHLWPISDGALGTLSYTFEFLMGYMGSPSRWRTMPWMVTFFGVLVIPLGLTHILLVISQPVVVGQWCFLCLLAAGIMLPMIPLEVDEVVAMVQHLIQARRRGDRGGSLWTIFWKGGQAEGCTPDDRSPELVELPDRPRRVFLASIWGMSFPWTLCAASAVGVWLMFSPTVFGTTGTAADIVHLTGALIVVFSGISMGEVVRPARWLNLPLALLLAVGPWLVGDAPLAAQVSAALAAAAVIALSIPRGRITERYGAWDRYLV